MRTALLLTTFNRPSYLIQCLESLLKTPWCEIDTLVIVDDCSTNTEVSRVIGNFCTQMQSTKVEIAIAFSKVNRGIKGSLLYGYELLFSTHDIVINLDADAIVKNNFVDRILAAKKKYPDLMVSGFNCNTLNRDGSVRHKHLYQEPGIIFRATVGGINLCINKEQYYKWVKPALEGPGNWDHNACLNAGKQSMPIAVTVPSVIQHIGVHSSMGHSQGGEPADVADDFKLISLPTVTLVGVDCIDVERLLTVADEACKQIEFGAVKILSSLSSENKNVVNIRHVGSKDDYSDFMLKELVDYIDTSHLLIIQHDGHVKNPAAWRDEWLNYDYIGAVWNWYPQDGKQRVGNGGFSLRSRRLHEICKRDHVIRAVNEPGVNFHREEDHAICRMFGEYLKMHHQIKFAPEHEANLFSIEAWRNPNPVYRSQFGIHGGGIIFKN